MQIFEQIIVVLINIVSFILGFWVWNSARKERLNQWFGIMTFFMILWVDFAYFGYTAVKLSKVVFWFRLDYGAVALFLFSAYSFFVLQFLEEKGKRVFLERIILFIFLLLCFLSIFTGLIVKDVNEEREIVFGKLGNVFNLSSLFLAALVLYFFFVRYFSFAKEKKIRVQYFLVGTTALTLCNIIFNILFPSFFHTTDYSHFGDYSVVFLIGFTGYAIVKQELFGIKVILTEVFVGLSSILLLADAIMSRNTFEYIWKGILFVLFLIFGYYLIKATQREEFRRKDAERLAVEIKKLDEAKTQFMLATQHHLRTPLTAIQGYLSMITEGSYGEINPIAMEKIRRALESTQNLIKLINEFLDIAQFEVGKEVILRKNTQIKDVLQEIINELQHETEVKKLYLKLDKPFIDGQETEDLPKMMIDGGKIKEAVYNVVNNSIKYTPTGGVTIKYGVEKDKLKIEIKDTGIGMEQKDVESLFERTFERGESAKRVYTTGRGIGLYLSGQIIKSHGGRIWATSEGKDKGSTFHIELPVNISSADLAIFLRKV